MFSHSISSFSISPRIHFLVAILVWSKYAKVFFISFSVHNSLFRLSSEFCSDSVLGFVCNTAFFSAFCSALYILQLSNMCSGVCFTLHTLHKLLSYADNLLRYDLKYSCPSLICVKVENISLFACLSSFNLVFDTDSSWNLLYCWSWLGWCLSQIGSGSWPWTWSAG